MIGFISKYSLYARLLPGVLTSFPTFILYCYLVGAFPDISPSRFLVNLHPYFGYVALLPFLYLFALLCREAGRWLEKEMFIQKTGLPTAYLITYSDSVFPLSVKDKLRELMLKRYSVEMPSRQDEEKNYREVVQRLNHVSKYIAAYVKDNEYVQNQSMVYGFYRNLAGGSIIAIITCFVGFFVSLGLSEASLKHWMLWLATIYICTTALILTRLLRRVAEDYAFKAIISFVEEQKELNESKGKKKDAA